MAFGTMPFDVKEFDNFSLNKNLLQCSLAKVIVDKMEFDEILVDETM
jgi:hypothetical protein